MSSAAGTSADRFFGHSLLSRFTLYSARLDIGPSPLKMPDRADYLARLLLKRSETLEDDLPREHPGYPATRQTKQREAVAKVLAVELGVTDGLTVARIAEGLPDAHRTTRSPAALADFAAFLRERLRLD